MCDAWSALKSELGCDVMSMRDAADQGYICIADVATKLEWTPSHKQLRARLKAAPNVESVYVMAGGHRTYWYRIGGRK